MDNLTKIYVYLENEGTDVWRPVDAKRVESDMYLIPDDTVIPDGENWQFQPGSVVRCAKGDLSGEKCVLAVENLARNNEMNTDYTSRLEELLASGVSFEDAMVTLRREGASPVKTILAIHIVKRIGLGEAKEMFSTSPSWQDVNEAADKLHQEILDAWDDETEAEQNAPADAKRPRR